MNKCRLNPKFLAAVNFADRKHASRWHQTEADLQQCIMDYLESIGLSPARSAMHTATTVSPGYPDIWFPYYSHFIAFEIKIGKQKLRANQVRWRDKIQGGRSAGFHFVIRSMDEAVLTMGRLEAIFIDFRKAYTAGKLDAMTGWAGL